MKNLKSIFLIFSLLFVSACNDKEDVKSLLKQADALYNEKSYVEARKLWDKAADLGSGEAEYKLSKLYALGQGVDENTELYFEYLEKSANKDELEALKTLGEEYYAGRVITRDYGKAFPLLKKAAIRGDIESQVQLGRMYEYGDGVEKDLEKALEWYKKAANENDSSALLEIGRMYRDGHGVKKDIDRAISYFERGIKDSDKLIDVSSNATISLELVSIYLEEFNRTGDTQYYNKGMYWSNKYNELSKKEKELFSKFSN